MLDADFFRRWLTAATAAVDREAARLTELDSPIGDADHGSNLQRGFVAVSAVLEKESPATPGGVLTLAGRQLISTVGRGESCQGRLPHPSRCAQDARTESSVASGGYV
ncbi:DAK2 domain-containing protein, partial [Streptomyces sp. NPDC005373]|uniref:DAK2 domain-containing protein n=1 Tax=Streptomyces sp. NPDC005373 TaxID=3156879 RepID=UPI0033A60181